MVYKRTPAAGGGGTVADDSVTYAKLQNVSATSRVLGRITSGAGDAEELTAANVRTILSGSYVGLTGAETVAGVKTLSDEPVAPSIKVTGVTGAANATRYVGSTVSGAPTSGTFALGDFVVTQNGMVWVCSAAGTPGTWATPRDLSNLLTTGEEVFDRDRISSGTLPYTLQNLRMSYFTARKTETTTQVRTYSGGTAFTATPTLCKVGLYLINAAGDGTLVAATANDTTLWAAVNTAYTRSWATPYAKVAGLRYALAVLADSGAAAGLFQGINWSSLATAMTESSIAPRSTGLIAAQTDLPASFVAGSVTTSSSRIYGAILP